MDKFVLIDGNSLINRAYYATPPMSSSQGVPTNAVYGFCNMLIKIITDIKPCYMLVAFDRKEATFRHKMYADYKGTRKPSPDDLRSQIALLKEVLDALDISRFELATFEADDIIGTLAKRYDNLETIIITGDKDSFQLVDDSTSVFFTKRGISDTDVYSGANFVEKMGIEPAQIIDLKALMGDSSDNIPGVAGVGEKTALDLVKTYGTIENLYQDTSGLKGKLKEKIETGKDMAFMSKTLATININVPIVEALETYKVSFPFSERAKDMFHKLELRNLLKKENIFKQTVQVKQTKISTCQKVVVKSENEIMPFIKGDKFSVVIDDFISFYNFDNTEVELFLRQNFFDDGFDFDQAILALRSIFENPNNTVIVYYKNQTRHLLEKYGIRFNASCTDVSIMKYLVDYSGKDDKLTDVFVDHALDKNFPSHSLFMLYEEYVNQLEGDQKNLYYNVELPLADVLFDMENAGFKIDAVELDVMGEKFSKEIAELEQKIIDIAGEKFNVASPKQLGTVLFDKLGLKHGKKNKNGYSTSADILEELEGEHEIISYILKYRQLSKLYSTYIEGFKRLMDTKTGLVHTTFNQVQTATGRLSSREPNLQNIPVRDVLGKEIRKLFSSRDSEHVLIDADYSQIELRLLAHFSKSEVLIDAFNNGVDVHAVTASQVFDQKIENVTKEMRSKAKAVNFGIIYGISDFGLSKNIKSSVKTAAEYIKKYFEMYPKVKEYMDENVFFARKNGYAITLLGRKRYIREINSPNYNLRSFGERVAMNMPLQGSASDIIKIAMINVHNRLKNEGFKSKLILQVHDELIIDALKTESEQVAKLLKEEMENAVKLSVKLDVDVNICECWYDAK